MANRFEQTSVTTREFTLEFLKKITDNFSDEHIIGRGGYGIVYKGVLENGEEVALKKLYHVTGLDDKQFMNEFNHLMRVQHPNITRLVGYCYNIGHQRLKYGTEYIFALVEDRILCFEYLEGGSLDKHLSDESCGLNWQTRFTIIRGLCDGLNYLHNGPQGRIYHLDLKPANIMLDENMIPKIGDFGLSRLFPSTQTHATSKMIGTPGYMPPEYIERCEITSKYDVFSLGVTMVRIMAGDDGYSKLAQMPSQQFLEQVHENWGRRLNEVKSFHTSYQVKACMEIALRCVEVDRAKRPTIAEIVDELNKIAKFQRKHAFNKNSNSERRGNISFSTTNRSPVPFDIYSCRPSSSSAHDELHLTDGVSYNYNGSPIPPVALKALFKNPKLADVGTITDADIEAGHVSGLIFVSERDDGLETLYIALRFILEGSVKVFSLADIFGAAEFSGTRLEDSGCIGGGYGVGSCTVDSSLIYVSTKEPVWECRGPWTVVYKTSLITGKTERLTPQGLFDLSPAISPSGKKVAVASFENKSWNDETEYHTTDIYVMNVDSDGHHGLGRKLLVKNGGWPSWGSDNIIFFHRCIKKALLQGWVETSWCVLRYDISSEETLQVTSEDSDAVTPAAISETKVAVATIRNKYNPYWHIEIFDMNAPGLPPVQITQKARPESDHFNPFVLDGGDRIGYHRCKSDLVQHGEHEYLKLHQLESPVKDVCLYRLSGIFPAISKDGSKLAFVDRFKVVWVSDSQGLRIVYEEKGPNNVHGPEWNQNPDKDILYVWIGPSFNGGGYWPAREIYSIHNVTGPLQRITVRRLTHGGYRNAFPSSSPDGNKFVFTSTRLSETDGLRLTKQQEHLNLYIMLNTDAGESEEGWVTRLTNGLWIDTQCQWSPDGDWIVFLSTRGKTLEGAAELDNVRHSVYLVKAGDPTIVIRVMNSMDNYGAVFSPDGRSIAMILVNRIFVVWEYVPAEYGTIFVVDIDLDDLKKKKNKDVIKGIHRMTHSRYGCLTLAWTSGLRAETYARWNDVRVKMEEHYKTRDKWNMTGQAATSSPQIWTTF